MMTFVDALDEGREDGDPHREEEKEQTHLLVAVAYGGTQRSQPDGVAGQFEDPENPHEAQNLHHLPHIFQVLILLCSLLVGRFQS
ncbi:hypothetical protein EYF80_013706 [Liparis tanakae]|uniref:Uncharacterized protein n=1 Tax=Liparis tanakae TaxID=230148 RepID=A0A4Z2IF00_9TELE|nr:hypothetical protein EYF80_013706 [Liparis tanakae]